MIDWDNRQEVRVVSLSPLPGEAFQELVDALSKYELPKWPIWVPKWQFSSEEAKRIADSQVARTLEEASNPNLIVAWSRYGEVIIAAKPVSEPDLGDIQEWLSPQESKGNRDWFIFLGLRRDEDK
jgi:hypothetical protein